MEQKMMGWQIGNGISWTSCKSFAPRFRDNHVITSSLNFYRPDALLDAQPTVSNHWSKWQNTYTTFTEYTQSNKNALYCI